MSFDSFKFDQELITAIENAKFTRASKLQQLIIPEILERHDILASAHSGSGKSASFILPLIQHLLTAKKAESGSNLEEDTEDKQSDTTLAESRNENQAESPEEKQENSKPENGPKVLILAPTRELANQISACIRRFTRELEIRYGILVGGAPYPPQVRMLKKPIDFLVATPGRLLDHLKNNRVNFDKIEYLVLDDIHRMIDMKMLDDIGSIIDAIPLSNELNDEGKQRQTLILSGNLDSEELSTFSEKYQKSPIRFELARSKQHYKALNQSLYIADSDDHKLKLNKALVEKSNASHIMITSQSQDELDQHKDYLTSELESVEVQKDGSLKSPNSQIHFIKDEHDLAADHPLRNTEKPQTIHLSLPNDILFFLQRLEILIDQKSEQEAPILVGKEEWSMLNQIERYIGKTLSRKKIEGLEPESSEPSVSSQTNSNKNTQTKNRNPYSGRRQNSKQNNKTNSKQKKPNNKNRNKNNKQGQKGNGNSAEYGEIDILDYQPQLTSYELGNDAFNQESFGNQAHGNQAPKNHSKKRNQAKKNNNQKSQSKNKNRNKNPKNNQPRNPQNTGNQFNSDIDERDLSWKQYISNISSGNGNSKTANKKFRKRGGGQGGNFDINHSPMAVSAKKVRDLAQNEEWVEEQKENKPSVQIRVKNTVKPKASPPESDNIKDTQDADGNRIGGKLGINK